MAIQFTKNITSRISTVNLERQLLHSLMSDKINLQRSIGKHRSEFFTNQSRQFIYDCINRTFNDKRSVLSKEQFDFEIQRRFDSERDKQLIQDYTAEYDLIRKVQQTENLDAIINNLDLVQLGSNAEGLIREAWSMLESGNIEEAAKILQRKSVDLKSAQSEGRIVNLHKDSDDWFEAVRNRKEHPEQYAGIPTGFEKFDKMTGGLFPAELTIVFGLSGKGKSTFMKALSCNIRKQGRVVLHCGNEENEFQMRSKYMSADSGEKYSPFKRGTYTDEEYMRLKVFSDNARGVGDIYIYEFPQQTDVTWVERAYRYLEMQNVHVDVIVIDYLDLMKPVEKAYSENDEQGKITSDLKQLAINCKCPVITATQAGTQSEKQEKKLKPFLTQADVFGTKRKVHSANTLIGIVNQTVTNQATLVLSDEEKKKHRMVLCVPKNRDGAVFTFRQIMDVECGKFYEDTDESDPVMQSLEKQSMQMIDESLPPDKMRDEIDVKELQTAKKNELQKQLDALSKEMDNVPNSEDDPFLSGAPLGEPSGKDEVQPSGNEQDVDDFFSDAPETGKTDDEKKGEADEKDKLDEFLDQAPDSDDDSVTIYDGHSILDNADDDDMPLTPFDGGEKEPAPAKEVQGETKQEQGPLEGVTKSEDIPHKSGLSAILAKYKKKA